MSTTPATQGQRLTGQLTHIEGWHYTIKDSKGEEVSFGVTSETDDPDKVKEGDHSTTDGVRQMMGQLKMEAGDDCDSTV